MQGSPFPLRAGGSREERWEARRLAKLGHQQLNAPLSLENQFQPTPAQYAQLESVPGPALDPVQWLTPEPTGWSPPQVPAHVPPQMLPQMLPQMPSQVPSQVPSQMPAQPSYPPQLPQATIAHTRPQLDVYQPETRTRPESRGQIKLLEDRQREYRADLQRQMQEAQHKPKPKTPPQEYFPFGRPGAGAPYRDANGRIIAAKPPRFNENDPNFLRANEVYQRHGNHQREMAPPQPQHYEQPVEPASEETDPEKLKKIRLARDLQKQIEEQRQRKEAEKRQRIIEEQMEEERLARERRELEEEKERELNKKKKQIQDMQAANAQAAAPPRRGRDAVEVPDYPPPRSRTPLHAPEASSGPPASPYHNRPPASPYNPSRRAPDPSYTPPYHPPAYNPQPPASPYAPQQPHQMGYPQASFPPQETLGITQRVQDRVSNEVSRMKNEMYQQQNELKEALIKLTEETQQANAQRVEAQRELERLREEVKQQQAQEEQRFKELYTRQPPVIEPPKPQPFVAPEQSFELTTKSLVGDSTFIPLGNSGAPSAERQPTPPIPRQERLQESFSSQAKGPRKPYTPEKLPASRAPMAPQPSDTLQSFGKFDTLKTANSSIGIDRLNQRNDDRLRMLDGLDATASDEIAKLDSLLLRYLDNNLPTGPPKLPSIQEDEDDFK